MQAKLPAAVHLQVLTDSSAPIQASFTDVKFTLLLTLVLVVLVIFLFIRNLSATVIPSLALPMSLIGTFAVMYLLGYSLDNMSLMALTLSVGFVVDDAIVMLENIIRHLEMGKSRMQAALDGAREVGFTILSMTLSLAAVFIPLLFLGGIMGRLFREFSVTIGVAVLVSGVISLTLTPMLGSRFLREHAPASITATPTRSARTSTSGWCGTTTGASCSPCATSGSRPGLLHRHPGRHRWSSSSGGAEGVHPLRGPRPDQRQHRDWPRTSPTPPGWST